MAECQNNPRYAWCKGPDGAGSKCVVCTRLAAAKKSGAPRSGQATAAAPAKRAVPPGSSIPVARVAMPLGTVMPAQPAPTLPQVGTYTFYRAVGSGPKSYLSRGGFQPRVTIDIAQIRRMMKNLFEGADLSVEMPVRAAVLHEAYQKSTKWKPEDVVAEIKREKSDTTCHVSTDLTPECGGYAKGSFVFKIEYDLLYLNKQTVPIGQLDSTAWSPMVRPKLVTNAYTIDNSDVLAFASRGKEVSFLTPVPLERIRAYHMPDEEEWRPLWATDGSSLWEAEAKRVGK